MAEVETGYVGEIDSSWKQTLVTPDTAWRLSIGNEPDHRPHCHEAACGTCNIVHNAHLPACPECV